MSRLKRIFVPLAFAHLISLCVATPEVYILKLDMGQRVMLKANTDNPEKYFKTYNETYHLAKALLTPNYNSTGWDFLQISTNEAFPDEEQAFAAGYLEGSVTHDAIYKHWYNTLGDYCDDKESICEEVQQFLSENIEWIGYNLETQSYTSSYWHQLKLYYRQLEGLVEGYSTVNKKESEELKFRELLLLNTPDLGDIVEMIKAKKSNYTYQDLSKNAKVLGLLRCSALVKILPDGSELFTAQDTWSEYSSMIRIQKKYDFAFHNTCYSDEIIPGRAMTFSSYPGVITSGDDFYVISSGLVTMETTIGNSNVSLWRSVRPDAQVSEAIRSMIANRLATNGKEWSEIFSLYNSGTYNNQWMIVDYKRFKKGTKPQKLQNDLLWVVEQIPSLMHAEDMTSVLRQQGYWPSYNVAYFKDIFNKSGDQALVEKYGEWFTYEKTPRALIFKRDHTKVKNLKTMFNLMRYNDFKHDPLSKCNCTPPYSAENAIAARCDLNPKNGVYPFPSLGHRSHGATDAKITSHELFLKGLQFLAVSGPPHDAANGIPPFQWSRTDFGSDARHLGHPDIWRFQPLIFKWI